MIKLTYIKSQARVRCEFKKRDCLKSEDPPIDLFRRARAKLEAEVTAGRLAFFELYEERLATIWEFMRSGWEDPDTTMAVTLGAGAPPLPGLILQRSFLPHTLCKLTIEATASELVDWRFYFVTMTIQRWLQEQGIKGTIASPNAHNAFLKACDGEAIRGYRVKPQAKLLPRRHPYAFKVDPFNKAISLRVFDINAVTPPVWQQILDDYKKIVARAGQRFGKPYKVLLRYVEGRMRSARRGIERFNLEMPIDILAAYVSNATVDEARSGSQRGHSAAATTFAAELTPAAAAEVLDEYLVIEDESPPKRA